MGFILFHRHDFMHGQTKVLESMISYLLRIESNPVDWKQHSCVLKTKNDIWEKVEIWYRSEVSGTS